jgi:hypothetical protein
MISTSTGTEAQFQHRWAWRRGLASVSTKTGVGGHPGRITTVHGPSAVVSNLDLTGSNLASGIFLF